MCEAYSGQQLQIPSDNEDEWKSWAVGLNAIDIFTNNAIPDPYQFENWQDWASGLLSNSDVASVGVPNAYEFSDWRDWATRFNEILGQG